MMWKMVNQYIGTTDHTTNNPYCFALLWVELSCKGRCFESFARGRECDCDSDCKKYGKCCSDYSTFCEEGEHPVPSALPNTARSVHLPQRHRSRLTRGPPPLSILLTCKLSVSPRWIKEGTSLPITPWLSQVPGAQEIAGWVIEIGACIHAFLLQVWFSCRLRQQYPAHLMISCLIPLCWPQKVNCPLSYLCFCSQCSWVCIWGQNQQVQLLWTSKLRSQFKALNW